MTRLLTILCICMLLASCKTETKDQNTTPETISEEKKELTVAEKIAQAHGFENWEKVNQIEFTFNVDRGENHFERRWSWQPKHNYVVSTVNKDSITMFIRDSILDPNFVKVDKSFINDKYWLLVPFQLVWDEGTTISDPVKEVAPISKTELNKIVLTYGNEGGYTPGDAYDIFYDNNYIIREWVFREGNKEEPSMTTSFENYEDFNGIKIAKDHKMADGNFNLYFSNIKIK
ncbi:hypothetical protein [uncultured Psychroserpens sp.]|uniref:hypothetical protein n=1 Tax=uncultured Psychroserpens sp. TaxID=255436 RepID=UPI0026232541|nr:hypothetical protein [uncultured Psychroserpens sp.]